MQVQEQIEQQKHKGALGAKTSTLTDARTTKQGNSTIFNATQK